MKKGHSEQKQVFPMGASHAPKGLPSSLKCTGLQTSSTQTPTLLCLLTVLEERFKKIITTTTVYECMLVSSTKPRTFHLLSPLMLTLPLQGRSDYDNQLCKVLETASHTQYVSMTLQYPFFQSLSTATFTTLNHEPYRHVSLSFILGTPL